MEAFFSIWTGLKGRLKLIVREMAILNMSPRGVVTLPHVVPSQKHVQCPNIQATEIAQLKLHIKTTDLQIREQKN